MTEVATIERMDAPAPAERSNAVTPMEMLATVAANGGSPEVVEKFMALAERWEANQARKAFDAAVSAAKAEIEPVTKNATGHNNKRYANFEAYARAVDPILSTHGLSYRFRTTQDDRIHVTCVLSHKDGHSETNTLAGPPDKTGSKNDIQAIGSTLTYLQRYTLVQALGLAASDDDDGSAAQSGGKVSAEQAAYLKKLIADLDRMEPFQKFFKVEKVEDLPSSLYDRAIYELNEIGAKDRGVAK